MVFAVDFDGTCVTHNFPKIGYEIGAAEVLRKLTDVGHQIILWTYRDDVPRYGDLLQDAVKWFEKNQIPLHGVNKIPGFHWSESPKINADVYIDDKGLGIPLTFDSALSNRPFVDWKALDIMIGKLGWFERVS